MSVYNRDFKPTHTIVCTLPGRQTHSIPVMLDRGEYYTRAEWADMAPAAWTISEIGTVRFEGEIPKVMEYQIVPIEERPQSFRVDSSRV